MITTNREKIITGDTSKNQVHCKSNYDRLIQTLILYFQVTERKNRKIR